MELLRFKVVMRIMEDVMKVVRRKNDRSTFTILSLVKWQMWFEIGRRYGSWEIKYGR